jgi:hypothetical protein
MFGRADPRLRWLFEAYWNPASVHILKSKKIHSLASTAHIVHSGRNLWSRRSSFRARRKFTQRSVEILPNCQPPKRPSKHATVVPASNTSATQIAQTPTSSKFGGFGKSPRIDDVRLATTVGLAIESNPHLRAVTVSRAKAAGVSNVSLSRDSLARCRSTTQPSISCDVSACCSISLIRSRQSMT